MPFDLEIKSDDVERKFGFQHWKDTNTFRDFFSKKAWVNRDIFIRMMEMVDRNPATVKYSFVIVDNCSAHILDGKPWILFQKSK